MNHYLYSDGKSQGQETASAGDKPRCLSNPRAGLCSRPLQVHKSNRKGKKENLSHKIHHGLTPFPVFPYLLRASPFPDCHQTAPHQMDCVLNLTALAKGVVHSLYEPLPVFHGPSVCGYKSERLQLSPRPLQVRRFRVYWVILSDPRRGQNARPLKHSSKYALIFTLLSATSFPSTPACPFTHITSQPSLFTNCNRSSIHDLAGCVYSRSSLCIAP